MKTQDLVYQIKNAKSGNHRVEIVNNIKNLYYYSTIICKVNPILKVFAIDSSFGTRSTVCACNKYKKELLENGYEEIENISDNRLN